jgi:dihydrodipicolinate synthase/N-acetylneuraminate lyase
MKRLLIAAAVTPLQPSGDRLDEAAIEGLVAHLESEGADGIFACGTTGEGVLLSLEERRRAASRFRAACRGTLIVHCGAQSTRDTEALAAHAAEIGAGAVAVIPPPYYALDENALIDHFVAAAAACAPLPFYLYAFAARSGYPLTPEVVEQVREQAPNVAGLKVSESRLSEVEPYLALGLPVLVGSEPLIGEALAAGAAGSVSGLATAFTRAVRHAVDEPTSPSAVQRVRELRSGLGTTTFIAAAKHVLERRGVLTSAAVRRPLRALTAQERDRIEALIEAELRSAPA